MINKFEAIEGLIPVQKNVVIEKITDDNNYLAIHVYVPDIDKRFKISFEAEVYYQVVLCESSYILRWSKEGRPQPHKPFFKVINSTLKLKVLSYSVTVSNENDYDHFFISTPDRCIDVIHSGKINCEPIDEE